MIGNWTDGGDVIGSSVSRVPLHRIRADSCLGCGPGLYCRGLGRRPATGWDPGYPRDAAGVRVEPGGAVLVAQLFDCCLKPPRPCAGLPGG